jgi:hypothetical protein
MDMLQLTANMSNSAPSSPVVSSIPCAILQQSVSALKKITAETREVNVTEVVSKIDLNKLVSNIHSSVESANSEVKNAVLLDTYKCVTIFIMGFWLLILNRNINDGFCVKNFIHSISYCWILNCLPSLPFPYFIFLETPPNYSPMGSVVVLLYSVL